jgi:hypothetical protein
MQVGIKKSEEERMLYVREALTAAISDEVDAVEDVIGYVRPAELVVLLFDIAVEYAKGNDLSPAQTHNMFNGCMARRSISTLMARQVAEA